jgi:hypothetical protein
MSKLEKKKATKVYKENGWQIVKLYNTEIYMRKSNLLILNNGGWKTVTTKRRMNQSLKRFGPPSKVFQEDFEWFLEIKGKVFPFNGNILRIDVSVPAVIGGE